MLQPGGTCGGVFGRRRSDDMLGGGQTRRHSAPHSAPHHPLRHAMTAPRGGAGGREASRDEHEITRDCDVAEGRRGSIWGAGGWEAAARNSAGTERIHLSTTTTPSQRGGGGGGGKGDAAEDSAQAADTDYESLYDAAMQYQMSVIELQYPILSSIGEEE